MSLQDKDNSKQSTKHCHGLSEESGTDIGQILQRKENTILSYFSHLPQKRPRKENYNYKENDNFTRAHDSKCGEKNSLLGRNKAKSNATSKESNTSHRHVNEAVLLASPGDRDNAKNAIIELLSSDDEDKVGNPVAFQNNEVMCKDSVGAIHSTEYSSFMQEARGDKVTVEKESLSTQLVDSSISKEISSSQLCKTDELPEFEEQEEKTNPRCDGKDSPSNMFAGFAFDSKDSDPTKTKFSCKGHNSLHSLNTKVNDAVEKDPADVISSSVSRKHEKNKDLKRQHKGKLKKQQEELPWEDRSKDEQRHCINKWHSFASSDAPLEIKRFQIFVAARLHAQAQESVVRDAMKILQRKFIDSHDKNHDGRNARESTEPFKGNEQSQDLYYPGMNVYVTSQIDPQIMASWISFVHFGTTKAKQIVQASKELIQNFDGKVPETIQDLQQLTGIGPALASILSRVNTRVSFAKDDATSNANRVVPFSY